MTDPEPRWLWLDDSNSWRAFEKDSSDLLEAIWLTDGDTVDIEDTETCVVNLAKRELKNSTGRSRPVLRSTWFWKDEKGRYQPQDEVIAQRLEDAFQKRMVGIKIPIDSSRHVILALDGSGVQHFNGADHTSRGKVVRRGFEGRTVRRDPGAIPPKRIPVPEIVAVEHTKKTDTSGPALVGAAKKSDLVSPSITSSKLQKVSSVTPPSAPKQAAAAVTPVVSTPVPVPAPVAPRPASTFKIPEATGGVWKTGLLAKSVDKRLAKAWEPRWFILYADRVIMYNEDKSKELERINMEQMSSAAVLPKVPNQFGTTLALTTKAGQMLTLRAANDEEAENWADAFNSAMSFTGEIKPAASPAELSPPVPFPVSSAVTQPATKTVGPIGQSPTNPASLAPAIPTFVEPAPTLSPIGLDSPDHMAQRLYSPFTAFYPAYSAYGAVEQPVQPGYGLFPPMYSAASGFNSAFYPAQSVPYNSSLFGGLDSQYSPMSQVPFAQGSGLWGPTSTVNDPFAMQSLQQHLPQQSTQPQQPQQPHNFDYTNYPPHTKPSQK